MTALAPVQDLLAPVPRQPRPLHGVRLLEDTMNTTVGMHIPTDAQSLGELLAASGYFTDARGAAQAAVKVMAGQELGFGPIASMTGIYIVKGRVTLSANLMAAAIKRQRPRYDYRVTEHSAESCSIEFLQDGEHLGESTYSMQDAQAAGLASSETWKKHPRNMLFARALSNGAKWFCPDIFGGGPIYTPDELGAVIDGETGQVLGSAEEMPAEATEGPLTGRVSSTEPPTEAQLKFLKSLLTRENPNDNMKRAMLAKVGAHNVDPTQQGWSKALKRDQVSQLIEILKSGTLPTGESDVPSDAGEFVPPADANPDEFFEAAKS
jgi:hypothetical protein